MSDLFNNCTPEAAARQLARVLAWAAECNLATLERLQMRRSSAKCEIKRQQEICDDLVFHCNDLNVEPVGLRGHSCPRLKERMEKMREPF